MTDLTSFTLAEARDGLAGKSFTALELADAHLAAMERARVLNAYVLETPEQARAMAREGRRADAKGEGGPLEWPSARREGSVCDGRHADHGVFANPRRFQAAL